MGASAADRSASFIVEAYPPAFRCRASPSAECTPPDDTAPLATPMPPERAWGAVPPIATSEQEPKQPEIEVARGESSLPRHPNGLRRGRHRAQLTAAQAAGIQDPRRSAIRQPGRREKNHAKWCSSNLNLRSSQQAVLSHNRASNLNAEVVAQSAVFAEH